jgi:hypothetical protein
MLSFSKSSSVSLLVTLAAWGQGCGPQATSQLQVDTSAPSSTALVSHRASESTGELVLYDVCQDRWIATGVPYRETPHYTEDKVVRSSRGLDREYMVQGKRSRLFEVDIYHLDEHMKGGGRNVPRSLRGIWWMDGNPVPEVILSFGDASFSLETRTVLNPFNGRNGYLFSSSILGRLWHEITNILNGQILLQFPLETAIEQPRAGDTMYVDPILKGFGELNTNWPTTYVNDTHWRRDTQDFCYNLRQIVDENGKKLPAYDYFVLKVRQQNLANFGRSPDMLLQARCIEDDCPD